MKKTIPFKKQLTFKTNINEITSISLENTLHSEKNNVEGEFIINGTYKITDTSTQVDEFEFKIPINIEIDEKYNQDNIKIDIEDFYYEIINNNILDVNIEIMLDNLIEKTKDIIDQKREEIKMQESNIKNENKMQKEERCIETEYEEIEDVQDLKEKEEKIIEQKNIEEEPQSIFNNFLNESDEYSTYYVYIVREGDTLDTITSKYNTTKEKIEEYNNIKEIKLGDKIIIPEKKNAKN